MKEKLALLAIGIAIILLLATIAYIVASFIGVVKALAEVAN
jgi:hypothetical protein